LNGAEMSWNSTLDLIGISRARISVAIEVIKLPFSLVEFIQRGLGKNVP